MNNYLIIALTLFAVTASASPEQAATGLIQRVLPQHATQFVVETIPADNGKDVFEIESRDGKIVLRGNNSVSIASALNHYLKNHCQCDISYGCGNQLNVPANLPVVTEKIRVVSPNKYRYAYNYCTHGYTMAWWDWPQWEQELDFIAMNGVNLALVIEGQEQVWINTLQHFGYTAEEVRQWLVMPTHQPWMYMSNLESYGGPVPVSLVERRLKLAQRIVARMRELGIEPMLPGYYGIVPPTMEKKFPGAKIIATGSWDGAKRPGMLYPTDPLYTKVADVFHREQAKLFGSVKFLSGDPFHEGGVPRGVNLPECGRNIFDSMQRSNPGVTWVLQAWQHNPRPALLAGLDKSKLLILDLNCEQQELWRARRAFDGVPWLWCVVLNFGGNDGLDNDLAGFANKYAAALQDKNHGALAGIGFMPEGIQTMPAAWELFLENAWRTEPVNIENWISNYITRRYGAESASARAAWATLLKLNYRRKAAGQEPFNSVMQARPALNPNPRAREWAAVGPWYRPVDLLPAWQALLAAATDCGASDGYRYDLADVTRQVLADAGTVCQRELVAAYKAKDKARVATLSKLMLGLFDDTDAIVGTRPEFLLGTWIRDARSWGATPVEADLCEQNARTLITIWSEPCSKRLRDYSNRTWAGLVKDFYKHRWELWLAALNADQPVNETAVRETIREWEFNWVKQTGSHFATQPTGDTIQVSRQLYEKYSSLLRELYGNYNFQPTKELVTGMWEYHAQGKTYRREFRADGSVQNYTANGEKLPWFDGYTWTLDGDQIVVAKPNGKTITLHMSGKNTLAFSSERWGKGQRITHHEIPH